MEKKKSLFVKDTKLAVDFIISLVVIALALVFISEAKGLPTKAKGIGTGDYPRLICYILIFLGVMQTIKVLLLARGIPVIDYSKKDQFGLLRVLVAIVSIFVFYKLLKIVGFPILAPLFLFGMICLFGYKNKIKAAIISVVFTTVVYILFTKVFLVLLPAGILG